MACAIETGTRTSRKITIEEVAEAWKITFKKKVK